MNYTIIKEQLNTKAMKKRIQLIGGLLIGVAIGAAVGMLMAPYNGKKSRNMLVKKSKKFGKQLGDVVQDSVESVKETYNKKIDEYADRGISSINTAKEKVKV